MMDENVVQVIDNLRAVEGTSLLSRLAETGPFIASSVSAQIPVFEEMLAQEEHHRQSLADLLDELNATPGPRQVIAAKADLHYTKLETLIPHLIEDKQRLIGEYERSADAVSNEPRAAEVLAAITASHRRHLERLSAFKGASAS